MVSPLTARASRIKPNPVHSLVLILLLFCHIRGLLPLARAFSLLPISQALHSNLRTTTFSYSVPKRSISGICRMARTADSSMETKLSHQNKRQKTTKEDNMADPMLTPISNEVVEETLSESDGSSLSLPTKLAYPFWYDPHPIAKWAANRLKEELPVYSSGKEDNNESTISLGKMYGVLVVEINDNDSSETESRLGYLKAYSGTLPRPKYGGTVLNESLHSTFCPLVYDRFEADGSKDDFRYEREEEILNGLTRNIQRLESCPDRNAELEQWKKEETELIQKLEVAKKTQKSNKKNRKTRRTKLRKQLIELELHGQESNENPVNIRAMSEKESHKYFLEKNDEYKLLEDQLVQASALDQREFRILKATVQNEINAIQASINEYHSQIQSLKDRRKQGSVDLQNELFRRYQLKNVKGDTQTPLEIFRETPLKVPPSGTGDCAAIKLFQYAFNKGYRPVALAEFWWGPSPHTGDESNGDVARTHGNYYPCCRGKCEPILTKHMLLGTDVESDPLMEGLLPSHSKQKGGMDLSIVYEDEWLVVVNKPHDVLSVPGRKVSFSIKTELQKRHPEATGPLLVHRLDYSTSGLLLAGKDTATHKRLQAQFIERTVKKRYTALLEGDLSVTKSSSKETKNKGTIDLPLAGDYLNRPMQKVERGPEGKRAITHYEIVEYFLDEATKKRRTRVYFYPFTGRTHQLRVHASHPEGLGMPIVGDDIYGQREQRLCLHAGFLQITHPHTGKEMEFEAPAPF